MDKKGKRINPKNEYDKCFQYAATVSINHKEIKRDPQRISQIKPFRNKYNWNEIRYPSGIDDWKSFEKNNPTIDLNIFYIKENEIYPAYISKHNSTCEKQMILLKIPNEKKGSHYLAVRKIFALLHRITSKNKGFLLFKLSSFF